MATVLGPKGRMTKPLVTAYEVGDTVMLTADGDGYFDAHAGRGRMPRPGDVGVIRRIVISDPNDGDDTMLILRVRFDSWTTYLGESEVAPATEANEWLFRQLNGLHVKEAR